MQREDAWHVGRLGGRCRRWACGAGALGVHLGAFLLAATALTLVNVARSPETLWFWRPLAAWLVLLAAHAAWVVGGAVRQVDDTPRPVAPPRASAAARRGAGEPIGGHVAAAARQARSIGGAAAARVAGAAASARERVAQRRPSASMPDGTEGWDADDVAAFASWARATDAWADARPAAEPRPVPAGANGDGRVDPVPGFGGLGRGTESAPGRWRLASRASSDGATAATDRDAPAPTPTGRFRAPAPAPRPLAGSLHGAPPDRVPAAVEARWTSAAPDRGPEPPRSVGGAGGATPPPPSSSGRPGNGAGPGSPGRAGAMAGQGQDVVLSGPMPVDPKDPRWAWLEAAASAWLAQRQTDVDASRSSANGHPPPMAADSPSPDPR